MKYTISDLFDVLEEKNDAELTEIVMEFLSEDHLQQLNLRYYMEYKA